MDCNDCRQKRRELAPVPYMAHAEDRAALMLVNKRQFVIIIVLILALVLSNLAWVVYESQYETVETQKVEQDIETGDAPAYVTGIGDITYGPNQADDQDNQNASAQNGR